MLVASALAWVGLLVGFAVGVAFGTLMALSTLYVSAFNDRLVDELARAATSVGDAAASLVARRFRLTQK